MLAGISILEGILIIVTVLGILGTGIGTFAVASSRRTSASASAAESITDAAVNLLQHLEEQVESLTLHVAEQSQELQHLRARIDGLEKEREGYQEQLRSLKRECETLGRLYAESKSREIHLTNEVKRLEKRRTKDGQ